jgi:predicted SprT family Zn-dependent metalloprotease
MKKPTEETYSAFQEAYDFFNHRIFGGELPVCFITFQRQKRIMGYVSFERWVNHEKQYIHELAINPEYFANYPLIEICQTLCHEMVHIWQAEFGTPGRRGYHNLEWARKMTAVGLMPSTTGAPGGDIVGETVSDYILHDGPFMLAFQEFEKTGFMLTWMDRYPVVRDARPTPTFTSTGKPVPVVSEPPIRAPMAESFTHRVEQSLPFSFEELDAAFTASLQFQEPVKSIVISTSRPANKSNRHKYQCPQCNMQLWGKPELYVICGDCEKPLLESD